MTLSAHLHVFSGHVQVGVRRNKRPCHRCWVCYHVASGSGGCTQTQTTRHYPLTRIKGRGPIHPHGLAKVGKSQNLLDIMKHLITPHKNDTSRYCSNSSKVSKVSHGRDVVDVASTVVNQICKFEILSLDPSWITHPELGHPWSQLGRGWPTSGGFAPLRKAPKCFQGYFDGCWGIGEKRVGLGPIRTMPCGAL